ncbi:Rne/Rng family ribonuclease, partial [Marinicella sediminis]
MLINATHTDEIRVAIADGQRLYDLDIDSAGHYRKKGNIYKAKITRVEPSLEACFVNYGSERHGFLPYKEISPAYCKQAPRGKARLPINEALKEGDEIIVQVNKEERGNKGAALSTYISLAGRYLVYMPGNHRAGGISRQIRGEKRAHLQDIMRRLEIPKNDGVIIRTAGLGRTFEELHWDFNYLQQVWEAIQKAADQKKGPFFIYQESDLFIRALRDYLQPDIGEILIDDRDSYEKAREFMQQVMPHNLKKLSYYNDTTPLFSRYQIERQIQSAFEREVKLPSGGSVVIDQTEALLSIDINSAKATKGVDVETTALHTNLEAADEIARQLKIRDLGGLVVIDFIDMRINKNQREVENRMRQAAESDRARVQIGKISKFGLLEMSRQRLRSSIADSSQITCPTCGGHGFIRSMDSLVISIIRLTEEEMIKPKTGRIVIQAPVDITNKILNEKRTELSELEQRHHVEVSVISNENLSSPDFHVQRYNINESNINIDDIPLVKPEDCHKAVSLDPPPPTKEKAALGMVKPDIQAPKRSVSLVISSWFKSLFSKPKKKKPAKGGQQKNRQQSRKKPTHGKQKPHQQKQKQKPQQKQQSKTSGGQQKQQQRKAGQQKQNQANNKQQGKGPRQQQNKGKQGQNQQAKGKPTQGQQQTGKGPKPQQKKGPKQPVNKNQAKQQANKKAPQNNETVDSDGIIAKKMSRPLGSVAELAAKKEQKVPSGAVKKRPIDDIDVDNKPRQKAGPKQTGQKQPEQKKPEQKKPEQKQPEQKKPEQKKPEQKKPEQKKPEQKKPEQKKPEQKKPEQK